MTRIAFVASNAPEAQAALERLSTLYGHARAGSADAIVALGGDGLMLRVLHRFAGSGKAIYGMNRGSVGFLMNEYLEEGLEQRLAVAERTVIHPLSMEAVARDGAVKQSIAFNEVSLLRQTHQAAKLRISIDGRERLDELICDGLMVATPAGSTAYNLSAHGPILPINAKLLALTPISAFRPRRWRGALLPHEAVVRLDILERAKRPVAAVADHLEVRDVETVSISENRTISATLMFDPGRNLAERILAEQFRF